MKTEMPKSWHISSFFLVGVLSAIIAFIGTNPTLGTALVFVFLPSLVWWGWTLKARSLHKQEQLEQIVMKRLRETQPEITVRRNRSA